MIHQETFLYLQIQSLHDGDIITDKNISQFSVQTVNSTQRRICVVLLFLWFW